MHGCRQIHTHNYLYMSPDVGRKEGFNDGDWVWVESQWGKVRCMCRFSEAVEPGTVWTWNAIGKASGAWNLTPDANESNKGFLLNHVISEELPADSNNQRFSNSDPVTGQAGWYDVRVRVYKADESDEKSDSTHSLIHSNLCPGKKTRKSWLAYFAGRGRKIMSTA